MRTPAPETEALSVAHRSGFTARPIYPPLAVVLLALLLAGCGTMQLGSLGTTSGSEQTGSIDSSTADPGATGSVPNAEADAAALAGTDPADDVNQGKKHFRAANFGTAERHFRRAVESRPNDAEAWLGLAAAYDRLNRFDLADRAYDQAIKIVGATPEILNNQGFSYMLRGDYKRAREKLLAAKLKDPKNPYVKNNLELLDQGYRKGQVVQ
jgi:tetratricopeptide (TPR) repeat protein